jgi:hypothetical protein
MYVYIYIDIYICRYKYIYIYTDIYICIGDSTDWLLRDIESYQLLVTTVKSMRCSYVCVYIFVHNTHYIHICICKYIKIHIYVLYAHT